MAITRRSDIRSEPWAGEGTGGLAVWDPRTDRGYLLNPTSTAVFTSCDGATTIEEIAERVAETTGLPADVGIVELALQELNESGLLDTTDDVAVPAGMSRRTLIARLALGAGAVALLPTIDAIGGVSRLAATSPNAPTGVPPLVAQGKSVATPQGVAVGVTLSTTGGFPSPDVITAFRIETQPTNGTVGLVGSVATYTPAAGFSGTDSFTYIAWQCVGQVDTFLACPDGTGPFPEAGSSPATVRITVTPPPTTSTTDEPTTTPAPVAEAAAVKSQPRFTG